MTFRIWLHLLLNVDMTVSVDCVVSVDVSERTDCASLIADDTEEVEGLDRFAGSGFKIGIAVGMIPSSSTP